MTFVRKSAILNKVLYFMLSLAQSEDEFQENSTAELKQMLIWSKAVVNINGIYRRLFRW